MCLAVHEPSVLAPKGSYVEHQELRSYLIDAHHLDLKSSHGARHAGNIMVLCRWHHENYGRQMTRKMVSNAIKGSVKKHEVSFPDNHKLVGHRILVQIGHSGEEIGCFFTGEHLKYWLENLEDQ